MMNVVMSDSKLPIDRWGTEMATLVMLDNFCHWYDVCSVTT